MSLPSRDLPAGSAGAGGPDLVCVGGLTVDNVVAADGMVGLGRAGGNGAYSAVGARQWCARVGLVSQAVASYPAEVLERIAAGGIDLSGVVVAPARLTACTWFLYEPDGSRDERYQSAPEELAAAGLPTDRLDADQRATWRTRLAARDAPNEISYSQFRVANPLRPEQVPESFLRARGVHLASSGPEVMRAMLARFPRDMIRIADPGWQLAAHPLDALTPILSEIDAFLPSEVELAALVPDAAPADGLAVLAARCPGAVAVKLGPRGVLVWNRALAQAVAVPAEVVEARDPTGAGDAFCGGFLAGLVETGDPVRAARFGAISAARAVSHFGADGALPALPQEAPQ